ncbi:hypothetical protein [Thermus filiformis]|uniref:Lipoprotein n=1 Tax=Thermus filiformis TaxID=276 RepID=A0A0D6X9T2_THEFI|nr:hypothetical protein [Thermus filiformis]KIX84505.1 hypothetical protein THFILI_06640 [Thermus filiformis]
MRSLGVWLLALLLAGCVPIAVLRDPEPVLGREMTFGLSALMSEGGAFLVPYAAYAQGDGRTEYNFSLQMGLRAGVKQALLPGVSLDAGLTLPPLLGADGVPLAADAGLLLGLGDLYLSPRVHWVGFVSQELGVSGLLYQATLGYRGEGFRMEVGVLANGEGGALFSVSGAVRF